VLERILVALDTSPLAVRVLSVSGELALKFGSAVTVLHVQEPKLAEPEGPLQTSSESRELVGWALDELEKMGVHASAEVRHAKHRGAAHEIVEAAGDAKVDLIVMGSRGSSKVAGLVMGSVTKGVTQMSSCSIFVVR
jgi:nucleotide-binding universal stress UspA family protein